MYDDDFTIGDDGFDVEVILPASKIPDGSTVRKITGTAELTLKNDLRVYTENQKPLLLHGFYLVGNRGNINQIVGDMKLVWIVKSEILMSYLSPQETEQ